MINFEFDENKSQANKIKHGIDFIQARQLWLDTDIVEIQAKTSDEPRYSIIGKIAGKHWSAVITYRNNNTRIISVRRSREAEVLIYES